MIPIRRSNGHIINMHKRLGMIEDVPHHPKRQMQGQMLRPPYLRHRKFALQKEVQIGLTPIGIGGDFWPAKRVRDQRRRDRWLAQFQ